MMDLSDGFLKFRQGNKEQNAINPILGWGPKCSFIFREWTTNDWPELLFAIVVCFIISFLSTFYMPLIGKYIQITKQTKIRLLINQLLKHLPKIVLFTLSMTLNAYVCLTICLGISSGTIFFNLYGPYFRSKLFKKDQNNPEIEK